MEAIKSIKLSNIIRNFSFFEILKTRSALALSNTSELEIKNLLKQIDTMIHHKKLRWERQKQDLDYKLQVKEQESESHKTALEQKNVEVNRLNS